jgi:nuclear GTP-binding protein
MEEQQKLLKFQDRQRAQQAQEIARRRKTGMGAMGDDADADNENLGGLLADAAARAEAFGGAGASASSSSSAALATNAGAGASTRRAFYKHLRTVVEKADVILEVLDARDPLACRAHAVEALALAQNPPKRVVLVLNKIDLVPAAAVQQWLAYLRREFPAVAFKASTQQQRSNIAAPGGAAVNKATEAGDVVTGAGAAGADTLLQLIKNYSRSHDMKRAVTVGVVGYPNVGKSSIINSLKRTRAVGVSATPGSTRVLQEVSLDAKVTLIDCPGIIFDDDAGQAEGDDGGAGLLLRNCVSVESIEDPEAAVEGILRRCAPEKLMLVYGIAAYADTTQFLVQVAVKRGKLGKGGIPDKVGAARAVLQDWNSGKIPFFVLPPAPEAAPMAEEGAGSAAAPPPSGLRVSEGDVGVAAIVSEWSKVREREEGGRGMRGHLTAPHRTAPPPHRPRATCISQQRVCPFPCGLGALLACKNEPWDFGTGRRDFLTDLNTWGPRCGPGTPVMGPRGPSPGPRLARRPQPSRPSRAALPPAAAPPRPLTGARAEAASPAGGVVAILRGGRTVPSSRPPPSRHCVGRH